MVDFGPVIRDTYDQAARSLGGALRVAAQTTNQATARQVADLLEVFGRDVAASQRKAFFETLGTRAQRAIVSSYQSRARGPSGYRAGASPGNDKMRRYSGGVMLNALQDPSIIFEATANGITFLPNIDQLDARARQWYRLNFGAAPGSGRGPGRFEVSISNVFLFSIGFEAEPSDPFRIPRGFWVEGGRAVEAGPPGTSEFYPRRAAGEVGLKVGASKAEQKATPNFFPGRATARGIRAEHFLDAGLARFTDDLADPGTDGVGLRGLYYSFYRNGLTKVRPTRPPVVGVSAYR